MYIHMRGYYLLFLLSCAKKRHSRPTARRLDINMHVIINRRIDSSISARMNTRATSAIACLDPPYDQLRSLIWCTGPHQR